MRVLALLSDRPSPPTTGSRVRNFHLWPALRRAGVEVMTLGLDQGGDSSVGVAAEFFRPEGRLLPVRALHRALFTFHQGPTSAALEKRAQALVAEWQPTIVHAEELRMAHYWPKNALLRSVTLHNVESDLHRRLRGAPFVYGRRLGHAIHRATLLRFERRVVQQADIAFAFSQHDLARYSTLHPGAHWSSTRNGADATGIQPRPEPREPRLLFLGSLSYAPNVQGLLWYLENIHPHLDLPLTVAGSTPTPVVRERVSRTPRATLVENPVDLAPLYGECSLAVVPLLEGSGTRGKILEALAHQRAVVSTTIGAEGLELESGREIVLADRPGDFAAQIRRLTGSVHERTEIAARGRRATGASSPRSSREVGNRWS
jgi:glycosyltransferase involved in cell wall biosynthesis